MATSTINGTPGAANNGATVSAIPVDNRGAVTGPAVSQAVVSGGTFSLTGLPAGTYLLRLVLTNGVVPAESPSAVTVPLNPGTITVDGSSTYNTF